MREQAEVVGLEQQLTVPTRNTPHLVDLWIALRWEGSHAEWTEEFWVQAERHNAVPSPAGTMDLVHMGERQGWVVARGVALTAITASEVESLVAGMVARVNMHNTNTVEAPPETPQPSWSDRVRTSVASGAGLLGFLAAPRDRAADIASS
ncbi:MAG: hypothetical protein JWP55_1764 [Mycobacterium sp.]|nr:hypothetical protein [Mycobacterium sp.]